MNSKRKYKHSSTYYRKRQLRLNVILNAPAEPSINLGRSGHLHEHSLENSNLSATKLESSTSVTEIWTNIACNVEDSFSEQEEQKFVCHDITDDAMNWTKTTLIEDLHVWVLENKINQVATNSLLKILRSHGNSNLPKDARTLLETPRSVEICNMGNGQYWHNINGMINHLRTVFFNITTNIYVNLSFNIDGLPLYNSSKTEFWQILFLIHEMPKVPPNVIGIYCGEGKPHPLQNFLTPFVNELKPILENGIYVNEHKITVSVRAFICDTPARAFVKGILYFNHSHGCSKCTTVGQFYKDGRHMSFPDINQPRRTNDSFRNRSDPDHHKELSPLEGLPLDMVEDFPVADSLHLIDLGIVKRCLVGWTYGSFNFKTSKWSAFEIETISRLLMESNSGIPSEIHRAVRGLDCLKFWKGLEFRTFFLYLGIIILKDHTRFDVYEHFLDFFCAITICSCTAYKNMLNVAETLLVTYIDKFIEIYGIDSISSNIHNLSHLILEVKKFGDLSTFSAYPFESALYQIKRLIRTGKKPLAQVAKRISKLNKIQIGNSKLLDTVYPALKNKNDLHEQDIYFRVDVCNGLKFTNKDKDKWFLTKNNEIVQMINAINIQKKYYIFGNEMKTKECFFEKPIRSSYLNIYVTGDEINPPKLFSLNEIKCKLVSVKYHNQRVFLPLLHTLTICCNLNSM